MSSNLSECEVVEYHHYFPDGVRRILASGSSAYIGEVDDSTVLKFTLERGGDMSQLKHEHQLLGIVGRHARIIAQKGLTDRGLYLERAKNGTLMNLLEECKNPAPSLGQRIGWCREIVEAVEHVHSKNVIHCDINPTNVLVDENLNVKLADFQGCYLAEGGEVVMYACAGEPCRYFCPREDLFEASWQTDFFALASTIHFVMTGQEVFSDIIAGEERWHERVQSRFESGIFPQDSHACAAIAQKCWKRQYGSASEVLEDVRVIEQLHVARSMATEVR